MLDFLQISLFFTAASLAFGLSADRGIGFAKWTDSNGSSWIFGGQIGDQCSNNLYYIDGVTFIPELVVLSVAAPNKPPARREAVLCGNRHMLVLHGGTLCNGSLLNDTWLFDRKEHIWFQWPFLTALRGHSYRYPRATLGASYWCLQDSIIRYGGLLRVVSTKEDQRLWQFNFTTLKWGPIFALGVPPRVSYATTWTDRNKLYLFGGVIESFGTNAQMAANMFALSKSSLEWSFIRGNDRPLITAESSSSMPRGRIKALAFTDAERHLWLVGGYCSNNASMSACGDVWRFDRCERVWNFYANMPVNMSEGELMLGSMQQRQLRLVYISSGLRSASVMVKADARYNPAVVAVVLLVDPSLFIALVLATALGVFALIGSIVHLQKAHKKPVYTLVVATDTYNDATRGLLTDYSSDCEDFKSASGAKYHRVSNTDDF